MFGGKIFGEKIYLVQKKLMKDFAKLM